MPVDLKEIAAISGMSGLFRIVKPTRGGIIVESLEENPTRIVAQSNKRISLLNEISIYTEDVETTVPLEELFDQMHQKFNGNINVSEKATNEELKAFMEAILPEYDRERVYVSDIKKIVSWYKIIATHVPFTSEKAETTEEA